MASKTICNAPACGQVSRKLASVQSTRSLKISHPSFTLRRSVHRFGQTVVRAGLDSIPGFSSGLKGGPQITRGGNVIKPEDVVLESEAGVDYEPLRDALAAGEFQEADDITRALLIELAGEGARERGWVYFTEVKSISVKDMKTMDDLWRAYSGGKFGFSVQKSIWQQCSKRWPKFFKRINWVQGEQNFYRKWPGEFIYSMDAEKGHLPLTNALRGTELIQAIFKHPAFAEPEKPPRPGAAKGGFDSTSL
uniref:Gun4-like protein n=1 Tax=Tetraselmis sp. GSL018 TaxID=582737 RepID=A0A061RGV0_9CHLO|mmetsp:Transcript_34269/g.81278  ORF Transcript_34269/g.81278 Transcript_34269/m.81278 type:complete len:250 (+) Transcript_34269:248-997(+)